MATGEKQLLRNRLRRALSAMTLQYRAEASQRIRSYLAATPEFRNAIVVCGFYPMVSEPDWLGTGVLPGQQLYLPRIAGDTIQFCLAGEDLECGAFGILQPPPSAQPPEPDLILVPGLGFDRTGNRLGRGGGYYDRLLVGMGGLRVGVAFAEQVVERVPVGEHDQAVDALVTENGFVPCSGGIRNHRREAKGQEVRLRGPVPR